MGKSDSEYSLRGCASQRLCYCCHSAGSDTPSSEAVPTASTSSPKTEAQVDRVARNDYHYANRKRPNSYDNIVPAKDPGAPLKSNLKKKSSSFGSSKDVPGAITERCSSPNKSAARDSIRDDFEIGETNGGFKRKVQWTDAHGKDLTQVKEFERSDPTLSDDECIGESNESCKCVIQ